MGSGGEDGGWERKGRERERGSRGYHHPTSRLLLFVYCFSSLSLPDLPTLWVCPFLSAAGHRGWSQTNSNEGTNCTCAEVVCVCLCMCWACERNKCQCALSSPLCSPSSLFAPLFSLTPFCSYYTTSNILIRTATPRQVGDCGPGVATGEEGKYQRRSGRGGAGEVEGKPNWWRRRAGMKPHFCCQEKTAWPHDVGVCCWANMHW